MRPPAEVLAQYPLEVAREATFLAGAGGLSGARHWRLHADAGEWCVKAWPAAMTSAVQLGFGHRLMELAHRAGLGYVPRVLPTRSGATFVEAGDWLWDVVSWQPGGPATPPRDAQLASAGRALAEVHEIWAQAIRSHGLCPGVARRSAALADFDSWCRTADPLLCRVADLVRQAAPACLRELERWHSIALPLSPCLCDLRREHVLFDGERVTGLIDFGAARVDHPANDLARYLADAVGSDPGQWQRFLEGYAKVRPLSDRDHLLIGVLLRSGIVASALHWLRTPHALQVTGARERIAELIDRLVHLQSPV
jgi:Ser/Thr protein kinase RdoA (MazF antagonist)